MDRTERFYKINLLLQNRGCVSFDALLEELAVSPATLKRDLQYLRDRMEVPITYDRFDNGYRLDAAGAMGTGQTQPAKHALPGMWFSERELHALLTMHQLMSSLDDDGVLARHLQPMLERVQGMLGVDQQEVREMRLAQEAMRLAQEQHAKTMLSVLTQLQSQLYNIGSNTGSPRREPTSPAGASSSPALSPMRPPERTLHCSAVDVGRNGGLTTSAAAGATLSACGAAAGGGRAAM